MSALDVLVVVSFAMAAALLVFLSRRFKIGGCRPCRALRLEEPVQTAPKNPHSPIGSDR
jgi:hypothetical protein